MQTMAHALQQLSQESDIGKMVANAVKKTKVIRKNKKRVKVNTDPVKQYHQRIRKTAYIGLGSLRPCSLLTWRPGRPVLANTVPGRIKWGLSDGDNAFVVVVFDYPQRLHGTDATTEYGLVSVQSLSPCNCNGYLHKNHCKPRRRRRQGHKHGRK